MLDRAPDAVAVGSDWPFVKNPPNPTHQGWIDLLKKMELSKGFLDMGMKQFTKEEKKKVKGENAKKLFNL